jgi:hypothetical protein
MFAMARIGRIVIPGFPHHVQNASRYKMHERVRATSKSIEPYAMASEQDAYDELRCYTLAHRDPSFIHQHVVDAFTAQHADAQTKPIALTFSLVGLYLCVEKQLSGRQVQKVHMDLARHKRSWPAFALPAKRGTVTVLDVVAAPEGLERDQAIHAWCLSVWGAFHLSQQTVIDLLRQHGFHDQPAWCPITSIWC